MGRQQLERRAKWLLSSTIARVAASRPVAPSSVSPSSLRRILVVRQHNQMGDMLLSVPCLRALRESCPQAGITLVAGPENVGVVRNNPYIDELVVYDKGRFASHTHEFLRFFVRLRRAGYDLSVMLSTVCSSVTSTAICWTTGAKYRLGFAGDRFGNRMTRIAFNIQVPFPEREMHQTDLGLALLEAIDVTTADRRSILVPSPQEEAFAQEFIATHLHRPVAPLVVVHPGAGKPPNRWPGDRFALLVDTLVREIGAQTVLLQGPSDGEVVGGVLDLVSQPVVRLEGRSIGEVAAVIKRASVFVCNDTGTCHVAGAVGCPTVALYGPTDPHHWKPVGHHVVPVRGEGGDIRGIPVEMVLGRVKKMLDVGG